MALSPTVSDPGPLEKYSLIRLKFEIRIYSDLPCVHCQNVIVSILMCQNDVKKHKKNDNHNAH